MTPSRNGKVVLALVALIVTLLTASFASAPLYTWFSRVTGFGGLTRSAAKGSDVVLDQTIRIRFDASLESGMPWVVKPAVREMDLKIGATGLTHYEAYNPTDHVVAGTASYNVFPFTAGSYFTKISCFCFTRQVLQPHERIEMPVTFFIDPAIVKDAEAKHIKSITLSYTFHVTDVPSDQASLAQRADSQVNRTQ